MEIYNLGYREGFVFIGTNGRRSAMEKRAFDPTDTVVITKAFQKTNDFEPIKIVKISDLPPSNDPDLKSISEAADKVTAEINEEIDKLSNDEDIEELIENTNKILNLNELDSDSNSELLNKSNLKPNLGIRKS